MAASLSGPKTTYDGQVFITVHGEDGNTEEMLLQNWWTSGLEVRGAPPPYIGMLLLACNAGPPHAP